MIQTGSHRDLRVDFFRGVALWWIFMDHIPSNWFAQFSLRNFALCDATEIFVMLAGYAAAKAYGGSFDRHGWLFAGADVLRRAWTLYIAHIFLFVVFSAQVSYSATALDRSDYLDEMGLDVMADAPYRAMMQALLLSYQPAYLNILPIYIVMLTMFAAALPLLNRPWLLGGLSFALYITARQMGWNLPSISGGGWYFNPLGWQFLFMLGAIMSRRPLNPPLPKIIIDIAAALVLAVGFLLIWLVWPSENFTARVPPFMAHALLMVDKEGMHPLRLFSIFALTWWVVRLVPLDAAWLRTRWAAPFILCGQHSLPVFCSGIFLSFLGRLAMEEEGSFVVQAAVNVVGPILLLGVGALAAWFRAKGRTSRPEISRSDLPPIPHTGNAKVS